MNVTENISALLQEFDLKSFLIQNKNMDGAHFLLQCKGNKNPLNAILANQLNLYPKAQFKIPSFTLSDCFLSPKSYEQCSSEMSAMFKSKLYKGANLLDLSGGLGVDDWALSKSFKHIVSLDLDEELNILARLNFKKLGSENISRLTQTAEVFIKENPHQKFDLIYLDADRRVQQEKDYSLAGGTPNYLELENALLNMANKIVLKLSPMADLSYLEKQLKGLHTLRCIGLESEVKEILAEIVPGYLGAVNYTAHLADYPNGDWPTASFEKLEPGEHYFLEAHKVLVKARLQKQYLQTLGAELVGSSGVFALCKNLPNQFMGRVFKLIKAETFHKTGFKQYLQSHKIEKANLNRRDFPASVDELRKTYKIKEGGTDYFFFTKTRGEDLLYFHCKKVS
ncbi:MAG: hypothetical protein FGM41_02090 [Bacteroidetes bacterium]|nr:hypothetical protein [Bacteroidota bacterium]